MCQCNAVTEESPSVGKIVQLTEMERRQEIDYRVMVALGERDLIKREYMRGFWDCFYIVALVAWAVYLLYFWKADN